MPNLPSLHFHTNSISGFSSTDRVFGSSEMAQPQERPRITEIQVRIDCNGCVQKIKKALQGINGISDVYIDLPQQKLTIIGWANPERIIKAIKKARKNATIYSCSEVQEPQPAQTTDTETPDNGAPLPPDDGNPAAEQSQPEPPKDQPTPPPPSEPPKDQPPPQVPENPTQDRPPPPPPENRTAHEPNETQHHQHKDGVDEVHVIHHHTPDSGYGPRFGPGYNRGPPDYSHGYGQSYHLGYNSGPPQPYDHGHSHIPPEYRRGYSNDYSQEPPRYSQRDGPSYNTGPPGYSEGYGSSYGSRSSGYSQGYEPGYNPGPHSDWSDRPEPSYRPERPQPIQVTHSYSQYRPPSYVTQYEYVQSPARQMPHSRTENYYNYNNGDYQNDYNNNSNGYVPSIFSEENPNACAIS